MKNFIYLLGFVVILTVSCKKDVTIVNNGIYRGVFYLISSSQDTINEGICNLAIFDDSKSFSMQGDTASGVPKNCNGTYEISETEIEFTNKAVIGEFFYDENLYLDTIYSYEFSDTGSYFNMQFETSSFKYHYHLKRK